MSKHNDDCAGRNGVPTKLYWKDTEGGMGGAHDVLMANDDKYVGHFYVDADDSVDVEAVLRLIATAPELLAALKAMQPLWHHMIGLSSPAEWHRVNGLMEAAIAKAEGCGVSAFLKDSEAEPNMRTAPTVARQQCGVTPAEAGGLVERLQERATVMETLSPDFASACREAATALEAQAAELAAVKTALDCALIREGNEKHRTKIAHQNMNAEIRARERVEAALAEAQEELAVLRANQIAHVEVRAKFSARIAELEAENERLTASWRKLDDTANEWADRAHQAEALSRTGAVKVLKAELDWYSSTEHGALDGIPFKHVAHVIRVMLSRLSALEPAAPEGQRRCATEGCDQPATNEFIRGDVGSFYCGDCFGKVIEACETRLAPEGRQEPRAYIVHAPEDGYYGTGPDRLQFHPLAQHDMDNGYRQTPLYARPFDQAVTEEMVEAAQIAFQEKYNRGVSEDELRTVIKAAVEAGRHD